MYKIVINGNTFEAPTLEDCVSMAKAFGVAKTTQSKQGTGAKAPVAKKQQAAKEPKAPKLFSTDLKDYEPKVRNGFYDWTSYKAQRSHYCYAVATNGHCKENPYGSPWAEAGNEVDYSPEGLYYKAKAEFEATYKYIRKADR